MAFQNWSNQWPSDGFLGMKHGRDCQSIATREVLRCYLDPVGPKGTLPKKREVALFCAVLLLIAMYVVFVVESGQENWVE